MVLDFGSQTTQLIGRRIRDLGVYTEIVPGDTPLTGGSFDGVRGIILSGSPESVYTAEGAVPDKRVYRSGLPLLGICYGLQRMTADHGGLVKPLPKREYGGIGVTIRGTADGAADSQGNLIRKFLAGFDSSISLRAITDPAASPDSSNVPRSFTAWMSHGDTLTRLAPGFREYGTSDTGYPAVVIHQSEPWFGLQVPPEVTHCERGRESLPAFVFGVCRSTPGWTMER
jgi:GMP synthase (glutamine-hydrolysing)